MFCVAYGEEVLFQTNAPMIINASDAFRVEFALNAKPDDKSFVAPSFEGFNVLAGPSVSHGSSVQIINGSMTKSYNYTISYVLQAQGAGEKSIGVATIGVDGKSYSTQVTPIRCAKVVQRVVQRKMVAPRRTIKQSRPLSRGQRVN